MLVKWLTKLNQFLWNKSFGNNTKLARRFAKPSLEVLEGRIALATDTFINPAGGNWAIPANWSLGRSPGTGDNVIIPELSPGATVFDLFTTVSINSLTLNSTLSLEFLFTVTGPIAGSGTIVLANGELSDAAVGAGITVITSPTSESNELDNVTIDGQLIIEGGVGINNGLTLNGTCEIGTGLYSAILTFATNETLNGTGTVFFGNSNFKSFITISNFKNPNPTLTIGPGITVLGAGGVLGDVLDNIVNEGTIEANGVSGVVDVDGSLTETATASLQVDIGATPTQSPGSRFVFGGYSLAGTLQANYVNGFVPSLGQTYGIISGSGTSGTFGNVIGGQAIYQPENVFLKIAADDTTLSPTSLTWDTLLGGADYAYQVSNSPVLLDTKLSLYWSSTNQFTGAMGQSVFSMDIPVGTAIGSYGPFNVSASSLGTAPSGAAYLLAVADPNNVLGNFNSSTNVIALAFSPPTITSPSSATFTVGSLSTFSVTATGTPAPTLSETGPLPNGVAFNSSTGVLSGTPTTSGIYTDTFTANNPGGSVSQTFTLTVNPKAYTPSQITQAYGVNLIKFGTPAAPVTGNGTGQTMAIIDSGNDATIASDLVTFDNDFGLPPASLKVVNEYGAASPLPTSSPDLAETSGDVEWAHAMAPGATILLIEVPDLGTVLSPPVSDLVNAVATAHNLGASVVSMSFAYTEFPGETSIFTNAFDNGLFTAPGTTYVASTGDTGVPPGYPATSPNVIAVGATNLNVNPDNTYNAEIGWSNPPTITSAAESGSTVTITAATTTGLFSGDLTTISGVGVAGYNGSFIVASVLSPTSFTYTDSSTGLAASSGGTVFGSQFTDGNSGGSGGGFSAYETEPAYQTNAYANNPGYYRLLNPEYTNNERATPDVSFIGGTATPVYIIEGNSLGTFAGTSLSAPCFAGLIAIADQGLANAGQPLLTTTTALGALYSLPSTDFHDVITGYNGYSAGPGYDLVTGIGTPIANLLVPALVITPVGGVTLPTPILQNIATGSVLLATFTQGAATQAATSYSATVAWGDGATDTTAETNSPLSIVVTGQTIQVFGTHAFTRSGTLAVGISLAGPGGASATAYSTADVAADVSSQVAVSHSGLTYNRSTKLFYGSLNFTNNTSANLPGSFNILLQGLTSGVTLTYASVTIGSTTFVLTIAQDSSRDSYIHIPESVLSALLPGQILSISLRFNDPSLALFGYNTRVFSDPFDN